MPRTKLSKTVSDSSYSSSTTPSNSNTIVGLNELGEASVSLPGLADFSIDRADQFIPSTNREANQITDLLRPQISDKLTESERDSALTEYEQGVNAERVKQKGYQYIGEQFKTETTRNDTIGEFVKVGSSIEKVKGHVLDYFTNVENNREKGAKYATAQTRANTAMAILPETIASLEESIRQAQLKKEKSYLTSQKAVHELHKLRQELGEVPALN